MLDKIERMFMRLNRVTGRCLAVLLLLLVLNVFYDVVTRYFLHNSSVAMQEMEWHLFGLIILYGMSVALLDEGHVRVDFIYDRFSLRSKALINIVGTVFFLVPLALLVLFGSLEYVKDAYVIQEISEDPGGLPYRWLIKGMIPVSFAYLIFCAIGYVVKQINIIRSVSLTIKAEAHR
ncbi:TRAP transporter small permease subunit [Desulfofustis limnaeus]|jgi:TRAP-type mannitol/chloroaromatic compound transport system permease small subunit|uniref:C4-dicarboxylate ABC transporter n=1 Tax=Desulfofustis limnaeus TaxID=2740163 RepID=A0ABM7WCS4_9BACT|nr:TRAP transporter small permease subunit [Desulfofustis limnaeus]MDX9895457.1 TRAP transporter small permease subunit [Desulfofustis sp.]BDD88749.1 C4-dicarboxylate ABC transporter [Desulfofustis limnaeus]